MLVALEYKFWGFARQVAITNEVRSEPLLRTNEMMHQQAKEPRGAADRGVSIMQMLHEVELPMVSINVKSPVTQNILEAQCKIMRGPYRLRNEASEWYSNLLCPADGFAAS